MKLRRDNAQPITARIDFGASNNYNHRIKYGINLASAIGGRKSGWNDGMNSISPWGVDDFTSRTSNIAQEKLKKKQHKSNNKGIHFKTASYRARHNNEQNLTIINIDQDDGTRWQGKKRTKTQSQTNSSLIKIRLNTIEVSNNLHMLPSQKYFSEDCSQRKMSMNKMMRQTFLKTSRSKATNTNFMQTRTDIQKKINQKMLQNPQPIDLLSKKLKTSAMENQNECPLIFFFEAKNSRNMMEREKNIMKIRNLSKKAKRFKTDGAG